MKVEAVGEGGFVYTATDDTGESIRVAVEWAGVQFKHLAPAGWPPRPGDLWAESNGTIWFFYLSTSDLRDGPAVLCRRDASGHWFEVFDPESLLLYPNGRPLSLVYRDEEPPF